MIDEISSMISWVSKNTQSSKRLAMMKQLVTSRRRLRKIYNALNDENIKFFEETKITEGTE